jgi:hypothetical protein
MTRCRFTDETGNRCYLPDGRHKERTVGKVVEIRHRLRNQYRAWDVWDKKGVAEKGKPTPVEKPTPEQIIEAAGK